VKRLENVHLNRRKKGFKWKAEQLHDFVLFAGNTGLRLDEARRLEFRDVEIVDDEGFWRDDSRD
jgi:integrase